MISEDYLVNPMSVKDIIQLALNVRLKVDQRDPYFDFERALISDPSSTLGIDLQIDEDSVFDKAMNGAEAYTESSVPIIHIRASHYEFLSNPSNRGDPIYHRIRFTIAHEMMHALKHLIPINTPLFRRTPVTNFTPKYKKAEWQADTFAASLLLPFCFYESIKNMRLEDISQVFGISQTAAKIQLKRYANIINTRNPSESNQLGF